MARSWVTCSSTNVEAMVNPLTAACDRGFVPDTLYFIESPDVEDQVAEAIEYSRTIIQKYDGDEPKIELTTLDHEVEFDRIRTHVRDAIDGSRAREAVVAVDITPGRKFMSAIAFAAGMKYGADHVYYFYLTSSDHLDRFYPEIPRTATRLYDFTEDR